ncbi:CDC5 cell division cycle 5-like protein, partial [Rhizoclosmatium hyalinum]
MQQDLETLHDRVKKQYLFFEPTTSSDASVGRFEKVEHTTTQDRIANHTRQLELARETMKREHAKATKLEKKLGVVLGGYVNRSTKLKRDLAEAAKEVEEESVKLESFQTVKALEDVAIGERLEGLKEEVGRLEKREGRLQERYMELVAVKEGLVDALRRGGGSGDGP